MNTLEHIAGRTFHGRKGGVDNRFSYGVDYLLLAPDEPVRGPAIFSRNRANLVALHDIDHGGMPDAGVGVCWVRRTLAEAGLDAAGGRILLLAQPRILGHVFNPVSFWLCHGHDGSLRCVIAEVNNTYGDRHSYLCHHDDQRPILPGDELGARKLLHVSPFQPVAGDYRFHFDIDARKVAIRIEYGHAGGGLVATLSGARRPASTASLLGAMLRRPLGSRRVLALIHWQALKLWWKGAIFGHRPAPPVKEVSR
ncbi:MAG: DUF1365 domain-containing protein [Pararhodobacter sp.]